MNDQLSRHNLGPLKGLKVLEFAGLGPAPFACMLLADMGADIITLQRKGGDAGHPIKVIGRGRKVLEVDLKEAGAVQSVMQLIQKCDVLVEGFRPGVMERLRLGPESCLAVNPGLIYARMTGWGQTGPLSHTAGHDINYIALTGALDATGTRDSGPVQPLNLLGDYGGGSLYLLSGILAALYEKNRSGTGQVVDAAIAEGVLSMMSLSCEQALNGEFVEQRQSNLLDGGVPWYGIYETADGRHVSVGALEPQFFKLMSDILDLPLSLRDAQNNQAKWADLRQVLSRTFLQKPRSDWQKIFEGLDACVVPVLTLSESAEHPHFVERQAFVSIDGRLVPAPAPRFSRTTSAIQQLSSVTLANFSEALNWWESAAS